MAECNSRTAKKVLNHLIKYQKLCKEEEYNYMTNIKKELEMSPPAISDGINVLIEMGVICNVEREGQKKILYVTPEIIDQAQIEAEDQAPTELGQVI